ncbi:MAG: hypothetical protein ABL973_13110 [Micropepsaceae bacterium]
MRFIFEVIFQAVFEAIFRAIFGVSADWDDRSLFVRERAAVVGEKRVLVYSTTLRWMGFVFLAVVIGCAPWFWFEVAPDRTQHLVMIGIAAVPPLCWVVELFTRRIEFGRTGFVVRSWRGTSAEVAWRSVSSWRLVGWRGMYVLQTERGTVRISTWLSGVPEFMNVMKRRRKRG